MPPHTPPPTVGSRGRGSQPHRTAQRGTACGAGKALCGSRRQPRGRAPRKPAPAFHRPSWDRYGGRAAASAGAGLAPTVHVRPAAGEAARTRRRGRMGGGNVRAVPLPLEEAGERRRLVAALGQGGWQESAPSAARRAHGWRQEALAEAAVRRLWGRYSMATAGARFHPPLSAIESVTAVDKLVEFQEIPVGAGLLSVPAFKTVSSLSASRLCWKQPRWPAGHCQQLSALPQPEGRERSERKKTIDSEYNLGKSVTRYWHWQNRLDLGNIEKKTQTNNSQIFRHLKKKPSSFSRLSFTSDTPPIPFLVSTADPSLKPLVTIRVYSRSLQWSNKQHMRLGSVLRGFSLLFLILPLCSSLHPPEEHSCPSTKHLLPL